MSLINDKIIDDIFAWAENSEDRHIYPAISDEKSSYYVNKISEETYMIEYSGKTLEQIKKALVKYSGLSEDDEILKKIIMIICQCRYMRKEKHSKNIDKQRLIEEEKEIIPNFIYNF